VSDRASLYFPEKVTFKVEVKGEADIEQIVLEYGVDHLTCGEVVAKAFPDFEPSQEVKTQWAWEMRQSGSLPPGVEIWWRWRVKDAGGDELLTDKQTVVWLDVMHDWRSVSGDSITVHWYVGDRAFGEDLRVTAVEALAYIEESMGLTPDGPIDLYIYADTFDMREAIYYEAGWTGGLAYPAYRIILIGISPDDPDNVAWGKDTEAHELTHVLVGRYTFSCLASIPTWLDEGLAEFVERGEDGLGDDQRDFEAAMADDTLFSVRGLVGSFSEDSEQAHLAYVQSYSLVDFLIGEYGRDSMLALLTALRDGEGADDALLKVYGFDQDGLEDAWREHVGAPPRVAEDVTPTPTPMPTVVPTFAPLAGVPLATIVPTPLPTSTPTPAPTEMCTPIPTPAPEITPSPESADVTSVFAGSGWVALFGALICVALLVVVIVAVVIVWQRRERP
jgi:hypothetical protein